VNQPVDILASRTAKTVLLITLVELGTTMLAALKSQGFNFAEGAHAAEIAGVNEWKQRIVSPSLRSGLNCNSPDIMG
jgi:hypothetical protein